MNENKKNSTDSQLKEEYFDIMLRKINRTQYIGVKPDAAAQYMVSSYAGSLEMAVYLVLAWTWFINFPAIFILWYIYGWKAGITSLLGGIVVKWFMKTYAGVHASRAAYREFEVFKNLKKKDKLIYVKL